MNFKQYLSRLVSILCGAHLLLSGLACTAANAAEPDIDFSDAAYPVVITPTRLRQSLADVPASVTIITAETLRRHGITSVEEALRMVPGMAVSQARGNDYRVNFHGTAAVVPRRLNVLIDGVSAYMPAFSQVEWSVLPVALEDIDRIEVIRGPDSAAYGPNSMMAVVNILTKHPKDVERALVSVTAGSRDTLNTTVRLATTVGSTSLRVSASTQRNSGYDAISYVGGAHDSTKLHRLNVRALHELSDGSSLDVQAAHVSGKLDDSSDLYQSTYPDQRIQVGQLSARWTKSLSSTHELKVDISHASTRAKQQWLSCWPQVAFWPEVGELYKSNPAYILAMLQGGPAPDNRTARDDQLAQQILTRLSGLGGLAALVNTTCGQLNQNGSESRTQIEFQDTYVASDALRFVAGLGLRGQRASSETYFGGQVSNNVQWVFAHAEYRPMDWLTANLGGYGEYNSLSGNTFSPRAALNVRLSQSQTLRAVVSRGTRTPDLFEQLGKWSYTMTDLSVPIDGATSGRLLAASEATTTLSSEQIWSRELGYLLILRPMGLTLDARVFDDRLSHLIAGRVAVSQFTPDNTGGVRLTGAELQARWDPSRRWSGWLSYAYLLNRDATHPEEMAQYSRHSGALGVSAAVSDAWRVSAAYYGSSGDGVNEVRYSRSDLTVLRLFSLDGQPGSLSLTLSYLDTPTVNVFLEAHRYYSSTYQSRLGIHGQVRVAF
ncbi:TonB-dependent receptor [Aquabacterium sp.]|uniref:TonB-dependent receptor plug domain-containing protein n=1 Tax=Aquabacterium sp. TaxID=1872578 RepID=UPI002489C7BF|nr:TonB-dependent receptor [Aquabacterium sp.]MDI1260969.1 TonB-dependent receptor [Aquabacterium sp.]